MSLNKFTVLPGVTINIISYIILSVYLYKISEQILEQKGKYIPCLLYTLSLGMISTAMFIRMYMMLAMLCVMFTYYFINIEKEKVPIKLALTTYFGFMTHYFFLIYAFFMSVIYLTIKILKKQNIVRYTKTILLPVILGFATFPFAYLHIFKKYRGTETQENLIKSNILENFKNIYENLNKELFNNIMPLIIMMAILLTLLIIIKNKKLKEKRFVSIISISTFLYFILTLKIIPIKSTRYFYCIYPIVILLIYYVINSIKNNKIKILITLIIIISSIVNQIKYEPSWIGKSNINNNKDKNIIYIIKDDYTAISDSQYLMSYNKIYYTDDKFENYDIINKEENDIVIKTDNIEIIKRITKNTIYDKYEPYEIGYLLKK